MNSLIFFALLAIAIPALGAGIQFPSGDSCKSPDGKWTLVCKGRVNDETEPRLLLLNRVRGRSLELRRIGRYCVIPCGHQTALGSPLLIDGRAIDQTSSFTQLRIAYQPNRFGSYFPPTPSQGKNSRAIATLRPVNRWTGAVLGSRFLSTRMNSRSAASTMNTLLK